MMTRRVADQQKEGATRLRPADRRIRAVVRPEYFRDLPRGLTWPCAACGVYFEKRATHAVVYGRPQLQVPYALMVCPDCASDLTPFRLELDRGRLDTHAPAGPVDDEPRSAGPLVADYVAEVLRMRGGPQPEVVRLRAVDAHVLADRLHTSRTSLVSQLDALGVLAGLNVRTSAVPSDPDRP